MLELPFQIALLLGLSFFADFNDTNRFDDTILRRHGEGTVDHQLSNQGCRFRPVDCGLHSYTDEAVGVIQRLPRVSRIFRDARVGVTAFERRRFFPSALRP
jgi:hypothetical protein